MRAGLLALHLTGAFPSRLKPGQWRSLIPVSDKWITVAGTAPAFHRYSLLIFFTQKHGLKEPTSGTNIRERERIRKKQIQLSVDIYSATLSLSSTEQAPSTCCLQHVLFSLHAAS